MEKSGMYIPAGILQGDDKGMPNVGTGTGLNGDTYGADISPSATNRMGSITHATKSDPMMEGTEEDPVFGTPDGDE